jgi:hypothetical protein
MLADNNDVGKACGQSAATTNAKPNQMTVSSFVESVVAALKPSIAL